MKTYWIALGCWFAVGTGMGLAADVVARWEFASGTQGWQPNPRVRDMKSTPEGLELTSTGEDPWITAPAHDYPAGRRLRWTIRMRSDADSSGELFMGPTTAFDPARSARFRIVPDGKWHDYTFFSGPLGPGHRIRLDPCAKAGRVVIASIRAEALPAIPEPRLRKPDAPSPRATRVAALASGDLALARAGDDWGGVRVDVNGVPMGALQTHDTLAYLGDGEVHWLDIAGKATVGTSRVQGAGEQTETIRVADAQGGTWTFTRTYRADARAGTVAVECLVSCDRDRDVLYLPWLTLFPGLGAYGPAKHQAVFAGVEYLADEPSSSEAEIRGANAVRRIPDPIKIAFPLMAINQDGRYIGLVWERSDDEVCPLFDTPDRIYGSGASVMGLIAPGFDRKRFENELAAYAPMHLESGQAVRARAWLIGGVGHDITAAVRHYVRLRGLPPVPAFPGGFPAAAELLARGWTASASYSDGTWRHAVWGDHFPATTAADACAYAAWLEPAVRDPALAAALKAAVARGLSRYGSDAPLAFGVSHVRQPNMHLMFGHIEATLRQARRDGRNQLKHLQPDGTYLYRPQPGKPDYASTHTANHANGWTATHLFRALEAAALAGDRETIQGALAALDKITALYTGTVPRGAQAWEMPLHTPDPLASAYMVFLYTLAHELTGRQDYLEQAVYWGWTGVPFVYLAPQFDGAIADYATCGVMGATNWQAPFWIGQPVQWVGLVYAAALHRLAGLDPAGPWRRIAQGITATGLQMTWPPTDAERVGLLPDFFHLRDQERDGPAIAPSTVQATLPELFEKGTFYDFHRIPTREWLVQSPCSTSITDAADGATIRLDGVATHAYHVVLTGIEHPPTRVTWTPEGADGEPATFRHWPQEGWLDVPLSGAGTLRVVP